MTPNPTEVLTRTRELLEALRGPSGGWEKDWQDTPERVAKWLLERFAPEQQMAMTTFPAGDSQDMVILKDIAFNGLCPHHLLPFFGTAHVAYLPVKKLVGLSKIPRVVKEKARRPVTQEHLTRSIADYLEKTLRPKGVLVTIRARHLCMEFRGVESHGTETVTTALCGGIDKEEVLRTLSMHNGG